MKIIDFIKRTFKKISPEEMTLDFLSKMDFTSIIEDELDNEVKHVINNKLIGFGLDTDKILNRCAYKAYNKVLPELTKSNLKDIDKRNISSFITIEYLESYLRNNMPLDDDKIVESFQKFIDANLERVKKEDEEAAKLLEDQYENVDTLPEAEYNEASEYDNPYFSVYGEEEDEKIIPPSEDESDIIEDDGSIEILEYPDYEAENEEDEE